MTNGIDVTGARYGLPVAQIVARSDPQIPAMRGLIRTHFGEGNTGSGTSRNENGEIPAV